MIALSIANVDSFESDERSRLYMMKAASESRELECNYKCVILLTMRVNENAKREKESSLRAFDTGVFNFESLGVTEAPSRKIHHTDGRLLRLGRTVIPPTRLGRVKEG